MSYGPLIDAEYDELTAYFDCIAQSDRDPDIQGYAVRLSSMFCPSYRRTREVADDNIMQLISLTSALVRSNLLIVLDRSFDRYFPQPSS